MRIAIYSRKSVETDTGESIQNQIKLCKEYFKRQDPNCTFEIFEDEGYSGGNINRPSFQRMMELVKIKQFDIVAVYKIDRIARNIVDFVNTYDELDNIGVKLVSITEGFDPSTPAGKMMMLLLASFAEMERMNIAQRVKDNMRELAKMGRWSGGTPPKGYTTKKVIENGKKVTYLDLINDEAYIIKDTFKLYAEGYSTYKINKHFKEKGIRLPQKTIQNMLNNPTYLISSKESVDFLKNKGYTVYGEPNGFGFLPYNRRPRTKGKKSWNDKSQFVGVSKHEGIIDLPLWIEVQNKLKERTVDPHPRESNFTFLSGGLLKCSCGSSMFVHPGHTRKDGSRLYYFRCMKNNSNCSNSKFLRVDYAESSILEFLESISSKEKLTEYQKKKKPRLDFSIEIKNLNKKIRDNSKAIYNLVDKLMILSNEAGKVVATKIEELTKQNNILKESLLEIERKKLLSGLEDNNLNILYNEIQNFIQTEDISLRRLKIKNIIKYITYNPQNDSLQVELVD